MRRLSAIEADIGRYNRAIDAVIDLVVKDKAVRPSRAWSMAIKSISDRRDACERELAEAKARLTRPLPRIG